MKYESSILKRLIDVYGVVGNPRYISEIIKQFIVQGKECYPNLFTYQSDWLAHIDEFGLTPEYTVSYTGQHIYAPNTKEKAVKRAILKGNTKYRDIDTGDILDTFDETKNLELVSVKIPVLTTTGKNLFDGILEQGWLGDSSGMPNTSSDGLHSPNYIRVNPSTTYICSWKTKPSSSVFKAYFYGENKEFLKQTKQSNVFTTPDDCYYIRFRFYGGSPTPSSFENIQIEEGNTATSFESYKSNILTTSEEVTLCGIGDVKDELNLITGELTQHIKNGLLNGMETWTGIFNSNSSVFSTSSFNIVVGSEIIYDKLPDGVNNITNDNGVLKVSTTSAFASISVNNFIKKLKENPIPFMYCSNDVVTKTVDLTILDQNGQNINQLMSFNGGTHFNTSCAEGSPLPLISVSVETDLEETLKVCSLDGNTM